MMKLLAIAIASVAAATGGVTVALPEDSAPAPIMMSTSVVPASAGTDEDLDAMLLELGNGDIIPTCSCGADDLICRCCCPALGTCTLWHGPCQCNLEPCFVAETPTCEICIP